MSELANTVKITLDRERTMSWGFREMRKVEKELGVNTLQSDFWANLSATSLIVCLWASLTKEDPKLSVDAVADMLTLERGNEASDKLLRLVSANSPESPVDPTNAPTALQ